MNNKTILLTGSSGKLGRILLSKLNTSDFLAPTRSEMDITNKEQVVEYFKTHKIDLIIHCAAFTNMFECEKNPLNALNVNIGGTNNLVEEALKKEIRFIYISTDYVYPGTNGNYKEDSPTIPFTIYGWTKLGGECVVKLIKNHCIIRTSFFDPENIHFDSAPFDSYCSKIPLHDGANAIIKLLVSNFNGTINMGRERTSLYNIYKEYKKDIKAISLEEMNKELLFNLPRAKDSSLNIELWKKISKIKNN